MRLILVFLLLCAGNLQSAIITGYCQCGICTGKANQPTSSGKRPVQGITCAASRSIKFGTKLYIEGIGTRIVQDRLSKRFDNRIDIYFNNHSEAVKFGIKTRKVTTK